MIPKFITKALNGEKLVIYGDGLQTRDFVSVKDAVNANIMLRTLYQLSNILRWGMTEGLKETICRFGKIKKLGIVIK